jgi:hypothetical protein
MAGQISNSCPGQDQKTTIIDDQRKIGFAYSIAPANETVAQRHAPGGTGERQSG